MTETVIVFRTGSLGDTVVALPALHRVRREEPESRIVLLTNFPTDGGIKAASSYQVLVDSGLVDEYAEYRPPRALNDVIWLTRYFRRERPNRLYYLMPQRSLAQRLRDRVFFSLAGIPHVVGLAVSGRYDKARLRSDGTLWESESMRLLRMMGGEAKDLTKESFELMLTAEERGRAKEALAALDSRPYLLVSLGSKLPVKDWGDANWLVILQALSARLPGVALVLIGSADEFSRCDAMISSWKGSSINLCGKLAPRESAAVAARALLFLGHDSGPAHLAAAVGAKVVTIFSARSLPGVWFPFGNEENVLWRDTECSNCGLSVCVTEGMRCIRGITPESVLARTLSAMDENKSGGTVSGSASSEIISRYEVS